MMCTYITLQLSGEEVSGEEEGTEELSATIFRPDGKGPDLCQGT